MSILPYFVRSGVMRKMKLRQLVTELETGGEYEQAKQVRETCRGNKRMVPNLAKWWGIWNPR